MMLFGENCMCVLVFSYIPSILTVEGHYFLFSGSDSALTLQCCSCKSAMAAVQVKSSLLFDLAGCLEYTG